MTGWQKCPPKCKGFDSTILVDYFQPNGTAPAAGTIGDMVNPAALITVNGLADGASQTVPIQFTTCDGNLLDVDMVVTNIGNDSNHPMRFFTSGSIGHSDGGLYQVDFFSRTLDKSAKIVPLSLAIFATSFQTSTERWFADGTTAFVQGRDLTAVDEYYSANGTLITYPATGIHTTGINDQSDRTIVYKNKTEIRAVWQAQANVGSTIQLFLTEGPECVEYDPCEGLDCLTETVADNTARIEALEDAVDQDTFGVVVQTATAAFTTSNGVPIAIGESYIEFPNGDTWDAPAAAPAPLVTTSTVYSEEYFARTANGTTSPAANNRQMTMTRTALGQWDVVLNPAHPDGVNYHASFTAEEQSANRDTPDITIVQGSQTANGFSLQITTGDNGGAVDSYVDTPFTIGIDAPVQVVTGVA